MQVLPKAIQVIAAASGIGAGDDGCAQGPLQLKRSEYMAELENVLHWHAIHYPKANLQGLAAMPVIQDLCLAIAQDVQTVLSNQHRFLVLGGDQSCSLGTWSAAAASLKGEGDLGLIWVDAHMDSHTPDTTPSGNIHGMPLAALMGYGDKRMTHLFDGQVFLKPCNIVLIGIRSFEPDEADLIQQLKIKTYDMQAIEAFGMKNILKEAHQLVTQKTAAYGLAIDMDGFDPNDAPGVGTPESGGILAADFVSALQAYSQDEKLIGAEIVEFNPHHDINRKTERLVVDLIKTIFCE